MIKKTIEELPVSLTDIKTHLRIEESYTDDDEYLQRLEQVAIRLIHNYVGADLVYTKNELTLSAYEGDTIIVDEPYFDTSTAPTVMSGSTDIYSGMTYHRTYITITTENMTEETEVVVTYYTGYKNADLPEDIKNVILQKITNLYDNERGDYNFNNITNNKVTDVVLDYYKVPYVDTYQNYNDYIV